MAATVQSSVTGGFRVGEADRQATGRRRVMAPRPRGLARLRPAVGLVYVAALGFSALVVNNPLQLVVILALTLAALATAGRLREAWPYVRIALSVSLFLALLNPLFSPGGLDVLWEASVGPTTIRVTAQSLAFGLGTALRLSAIILAFAVYSTALDADEQLGLLGRFSFRSALIVSLATRLFPVLTRDGSRLADGQRARGVELDRGSRRERVAHRIPLLSALTTQSLERAMDVAESMEARAYGRPGRTTWLKRRRWTAGDRVTVAAAATAAAALVAGLAGGAFAYAYFPLLEDPWPALAQPVWVIAVVGLTVPLMLEVRWRRWPSSRG